MYEGEVPSQTAGLPLDHGFQEVKTGSMQQTHTSDVSGNQAAAIDQTAGQEINENG
jgi:hypothetical protein